MIRLVDIMVKDNISEVDDRWKVADFRVGKNGGYTLRTWGMGYMIRTLCAPVAIEMMEFDRPFVVSGRNPGRRQV